MNQSLFTLTESLPLAPGVTLWLLTGDCSAITKPGQFVNIALDGFFLRRPISVCDCEDNALTLIFKTVGHGTAAMEKMQPGQRLDLLTGLGNGYDTAKTGSRPLLIGGGAGVPPMFLLAKTLLKEGKNPAVILGFNKKDEIFFENEFKSLGIDTFVTTVDGSCGIRGFVTDAMKEVPDYTYTCACGPEPMLKAVYNTAGTSGQYSFEERMGCGFGACMGCSCKTKYGNKRICKDGPVLEKEEILW